MTVSGMFSLFSCTGLHEPQLLEVVPGRLDEFPADSYVLRNPEDSDPVLFSVTWTETLFYMSGRNTPVPVAPVKYALQIDNAGNGFENPKTVAATSSLGVNIHTKEFNLLVLDSLAAKAGQPCEVELRLLTTYGQSSSCEAVSENSVSLTIIPFSDRNPLQMVYITGESNGWESGNTAKMIPMFKDNSDDRNHTYTFTGWLPAGGFRFLPAEALGTGRGYWDKGGNAMEYTENGTPFHNVNAGYKRVTINLRTMAYSMSDYDASDADVWMEVGMIGSFCNWENEPAMSRISVDNPHIWRLTCTLPELAEGEIHNVKFRALRSWSSRWAAVDPYAVPYGKTVFLTGTEPDPNVILDEGGEYEVLFNDLTGHYAFLKK